MTHLPLTRIKLIMKTSEGSSQINKDALYVMGRATEMFVKEMARDSHSNSRDPKNLFYEHLVDLIQRNQKFSFIENMIPKKIKVSTYKKMMTLAKNGNNSETSSSSGSSSSSSSSDDDEDDSDNDVEVIPIDPNSALQK